MAQRQTVVYVARTMQQGYLLKNVLAEAGIEAVVTNDVLEGGSGVDVVGWATQPRVLVDEHNAEAARRIALDFDRAAAATTDHTGNQPDEAEAIGESLDVWPRCPKCGAPRITRCPVCQTTGSDFPPADPTFSASFLAGESDQTDAEPPVVLMCPTCDEPFVPDYPRRCAWCDHEYPDGFDMDLNAGPPEEIGTRVIAVIAILLTLSVALLLYFMFLV